ncbi:hypothetical protein BgiBS90_037221, partial [Biomphalaria glabrata]
MSYPFELIKTLPNCVLSTIGDKQTLYKMLINFDDMDDESNDGNPNQCNETTWSGPN